MENLVNYQEILINASKGMIRVKDPLTLLKMITRYIDRNLWSSHVGVLLYEKKHRAYVLINSKGGGGSKIPVGYVQIPEDSPLVKFFTSTNNGVFARKEGLILNELEHLKNFEIFVNKKERTAIRYEDIRKEMNYLQAEVCVPSYYKKELVGILMLGPKLSAEPYTEEELRLFVGLANDVAMAVKNAELIKDLKTAYEKEHRIFIETSVALATAIDARDRYTRGHSERVSHYSLVIAKELIDAGVVEYDREFMETVQLSALLHDIGKIGIRDQILNKPARLTPEEFEIMKTHVTIGANIVKPVKSLENLQDGILYHHERFDGEGYPFGMKGEDIPLIGRIVNVADSYDTIVTARAYKDSILPAIAMEELKRCRGTQFDPAIVDAFVRAYENDRLTKKDYMDLEFTRIH